MQKPSQMIGHWKYRLMFVEIEFWRKNKNSVMIEMTMVKYDIVILHVQRSYEHELHVNIQMQIIYQMDHLLIR